MSNDANITATQMHWQPPLLRLTQVVYQGLDEGKETTLYVNPQLIQKISRAVFWVNNPDGSKSPGAPATEIHCCHFVCYVAESPETVALLRDKAMGFKPTLEAT